MNICVEKKLNSLSNDKIIKSLKTNTAKNIIVRNNSNQDIDLEYKKYTVEDIIKLFIFNC